MARSFVNAGIVVLVCSWSALIGVVQSAAGASLPIQPQESISSPEIHTQPELGFTSQGIVWNQPITSDIQNIPKSEIPVPDSGVFSVSTLTFPSASSSDLPVTSNPLPVASNQLNLQWGNGLLLTGRKGSTVFHGVIEGSPNGRSGYVRFVLNRAGRGSASISLDGSTERTVIAIQVDEAGNVAPTSNTSPEAVSVTGTLMRFSDGSIGFQGVVTDGKQQLPIRLLQAVPSPDVTATVKGEYTLVLENKTVGGPMASGMAGFGVLQIKKSGAVSVSGRLADGSSFSQGTQLNSSGKWTLYARSGSGTVLSGNVSFADLSNSDCRGPIQWQRPAGTETATNQIVPLSLRGSRFVADNAFGSSTQWTFKARDGSGGTQASGEPTPVPGNALQLKSTGADQTELKLDRADGTLSGSFISPGSFERQSLAGIFLQKTNEGFGLTGPLSSGAASSDHTGKFTLKAVQPAPSSLFTSDGRLNGADFSTSFNNSSNKEIFSVPAPSTPVLNNAPAPESTGELFDSGSLRLPDTGSAEMSSPAFSNEQPTPGSSADVMSTGSSLQSGLEGTPSGPITNPAGEVPPSVNLPPADVSLPSIPETGGLTEPDTFASGTIETPVVIPIPPGTKLSAASIIHLPPSRLFRLGKERKHYTVAELKNLFTEARFQGAATLVLNEVTFTL